MSLALAVFAGFRARTFGRRADALNATLLPRQVSWLPPASRGDYGGAELETQVRRLRTAGRWSAAAFVGSRSWEQWSELPTPRRGSSSMTVTYLVDGTTRTVGIYRDWNSDLKYAPGQTVTVVYDPADPDRVRTLAERNDNQLVLWCTFGTIVVGCVGIPFSALSMTAWRGRYRAVRATGWRRGTAKVL